MDNSIIEINEKDFQTKVLDESSNKLVVVDFWAPWCGPCKQLAPTMEKVALENIDSFNLVKINIDENQQIAAQLRIQSIPMVYAFKDKQVVNAFQGVISENEFIQFIEKSLGKNLKEDLKKFYTDVKKLIVEKKFNEAEEQLLNFFAENTNDAASIALYLECLIEQKKYEEISNFTSSLNEEMKNHQEITQVIKKIKIIQESESSEPISILLDLHLKKPDDTKILLKISEYYFSINDYDNAFSYLLSNYQNNKEVIKKKLIEFFDVLGNEHEATKKFRKKFSSMLFS